MQDMKVLYLRKHYYYNNIAFIVVDSANLCLSLDVDLPH